MPGLGVPRALGEPQRLLIDVALRCLADLQLGRDTVAAGSAKVKPGCMGTQNSAVMGLWAYSFKESWRPSRMSGLLHCTMYSH